MGKLIPKSLLALLRPSSKKSPATTAAAASAAAASTVGVLAFEAASLMSKTAHLHRSLADDRIARLRDVTLHLEGVRKLVSDDDDHLLSLALAEIADSVVQLSRAIARLAARCSDPVLAHFDLAFADLIKTGADLHGFGFPARKIDSRIRKMERLAAATADLYQELEVLAELEQGLRRLQRNSPGLMECRRRVAEQRQHVKCLRDASLWGRSYNYTVGLLARSLFTIVEKIRLVFGFQHSSAASAALPRSHSIAALIHPSDANSLTRFSSGPLLRPGARSGSLPSRQHKTRWPVRPFGECMAGGNAPAVLDSCIQSSDLLPSTTELTLDLSDTKRKLMNAPPGTLGAAALALHYANVITVIERFVATPHLIGPDARDDLYHMLPASIRAALRARLKSYAKNLALCVYDPVLAGEWTEAVARILEWLAPLAHNMIKWQSERTFEQQHLVSSTNVLLLQTLYYANQTKTEAAITELLVGLNYMWRFGKELSAKARYGSFGSRNHDDCLDPKVDVYVLPTGNELL